MTWSRRKIPRPLPRITCGVCCGRYEASEVEQPWLDQMNKIDRKIEGLGGWIYVVAGGMSSANIPQKCGVYTGFCVTSHNLQFGAGLGWFWCRESRGESI